MDVHVLGSAPEWAGGVMNVKDARAALESKTRITAGSRSQHTEVMKAADAYALAVLDEARGTAGHFKVNPLGSCFCRSCEIRQAIQKLGKEPAKAERN